jgi:hypothetical protein
VRALLPLLALGCLPAGCAALGTAAAGALGQSALSRASPLAPLRPAAEQYVPRDVEPGQVTLRELAFDPGGVTALAALAGDGRALRRARLAPAAAAPCTAGWVAETIWLDKQQRWDRPLGWSGDHEVELRFAAPLALLREPVVLDLLVQEKDPTRQGQLHERCLRQPLGDPAAGLGLGRKSRASAGGGFGLLGSVSANGSDANAIRGFQASGSLGAWLGHWRLSGRLDVCAMGCDPRGSLLTFPVAATVERLLVTGKRFSLAAALGYQPGRIDDLVSVWRGPGTWVHGPRAGLLLLGPRAFAGADPSQGYASRGLALFVSRQFHTVYPTLPEGITTAQWAWLFGVEVTAL